MAFHQSPRVYIDDEAFNLLVRASFLVSAQEAFSRVSTELQSEMTSSGSQQFARGRGGQPPRTRANDGDKEIFRLKDDDYEKIVSYLEIPEHFQGIIGGGRKTTVGKKYGTKAVVFKTMLAALQHHGFPTQITPANLQKRFDRYVKRYKDALEVKLDSGGGLTKEERAEGILLKDKLNRICPHFERMHAIYGARPNVAPCVLGDVGVEENDLIQAEETNENVNGDLDDELQENVDPTHPIPAMPTEILQGGSPSAHSSPGQEVPTPSILRNHTTDQDFWDNLEGYGMGQHSSSCECHHCRIFVGVIEDSEPVPTESNIVGARPPLRAVSTNGPAPTPKKTKNNPVQASKEALANSKPSFTAIYAKRISQKADYRKELISSRDKWKTEEMLERKAARLEAQRDLEKKYCLERKHQLEMEAVVADNARKKSRAEFEHAVELSISKARAAYDHEKEMAKAARRTALLTTLFGSNKSPSEITSLLPIVDQIEE